MNPTGNRFPNLVVHASAGAGKTFQLSNRYIALAAAGTSPDTILATTFTRKAAGEILDRVLFRLAEAASDDKKLGELASHIGDLAFDRVSCVTLLCRLVRVIHRLRISTLDSFFIQVAQSFCLELGLPPGWTIAEETDDARRRNEAIQTLLQNETTDDVLRLMHLLSKGEAARSVAEQIRGIVHELYAFYQEAPAEAWQALPRRKPLDSDQLEAALSALAAVELPGNQHYVKARSGDLEAAEAADWETFLGRGLAAKILAGEEKYQRVVIPADVAAVYKPLIEHAKALLVGKIADQTAATRGLLARFDAAYRRIKLRQRGLRFDDVTRLLAESLDERGLDRVVYRLDARVAHLLLDEFQDTSPQQWRVLRPFARRIVAHPGRQSFFCVGDVKQAIYGWRGGVAEILEILRDELDGLAFSSLETSWRSSRPVIETVNRIFANLRGNEALRDHGAAAERWQKRFAKHATMRKATPGHCRLSVAPRAEEGGDQGTATLIHAAEQVARLAGEAADCSIGVLVRRNTAVARLIYELRRRNVEASEEGGNPLTDSPAVQLLVSLLTLADHPGDTAARFHVAHSPLGAPLGLSNHGDTGAARRFSAAARRQLVEQGYGPVLRAWTQLLAPAVDKRDLDRLLQLVEMAYAYEPSATLRADQFIEVVASRRVESPSGARVRVMTVHQAKGLQFDIVVLPELDARLSGQTPSLVVGRSSPTQPIERVCRYVNANIRPVLPEAFQQMHEDCSRQGIEEALCVLYVALTRPIHALHMIIAPAKENEKFVPATAAGILRCALGSQRAEPLSILYEYGDPDWIGKRAVERRPQAAAREEPLIVELAPSRPRARRGLESRSPSELEGGPRIDLGAELQIGKIAAFDWGTAVHKCFEQIAWLDRGSPDDQALRLRLQALRLPEVDLGAVIAQFRRALAFPTIRAVLSRSAYRKATAGADAPLAAILAAYPGDLDPRVWNERSFVVRQDETILRGQIDRLVVLFDRDTPVAAEILDFKSDLMDANDAAARQAKIALYRPQLEAYRSAVSGLYGLAADRVSTRLVFVESGLVVTVPW